MMDGEEIGFCFKCQVSFSTFEDLSEHSCDALNLDAIDVKGKKDNVKSKDEFEIDVKAENDHEESKDEFDSDMSSVEVGPVTTFKKLYECHRKRFPNVKITNTNKDFKKSATICLQELLQLNEPDIFDNKEFWKKINYFIGKIPNIYKKHHYKNMFHAYKDFFETEFHIPPTNNSNPIQSHQDTIDEEIVENSEVIGNEFDLQMSCDEIRPTTSYKKLFEFHRSRFPKVSLLNNYNEFKETSAICLQELLQLDKKDILDNEVFRKEIHNFVVHVPQYYQKKKGNKNRMFGAHKQYFEREFNILPSNLIQANYSDKDCGNVGIVKAHNNSNDISNDILKDISNDISKDISNDVSNDISYDISNDISNYISNDISKDIPNDISNDISNVISNEISNDITNEISNGISNDFIDYEPEIMDIESKLDISEEFLSKILKTVNELCDDIKNGDPDVKRMLEVNLNLNNAVSCYKSMLCLRKKTFVQKKNQELVNHKTREIIQPYQCDYEYIDGIPKYIKDNQITKDLDNFGQFDDKDASTTTENDYTDFENLQSEENRELRKRKRKRHSDPSDKVLESRNQYEFKKSKKEPNVKYDSKKLENGKDSLLSESEKKYDALIEKQTESKDQLINQDSGNIAFEKTEKVFDCDDISNTQSYPYLKFDHEKDMFQCSICNYMSLKKCNSLRHIARNHQKEIRSNTAALSNMIAAETNDCGKSFCRKLYGDREYNKKFWCKECTTRFFSNLKERQKMARLKQKKRNPTLKKDRKRELCQECGKNVQYLSHHILRVHTVENVKCSICEKVLKNSLVLKAHNNDMHEKIPCAHCGKLYGVGSKMLGHIQAQHTPNEDKKYKCEVCRKGFSASYRLKDHNNIHTGEKPYKCQFCSACFASKGTHAMHERSHVGRGRKHTKK